MLRNVFFVVESLDIKDMFQRFSVFLKLENYEFIEMGDFVKSELPKGVNFPVLLDRKWFEKPEFEVEIRTSRDRKFVGILAISRENSKLTSSGLATLFNLKNEEEQLEMQCTLVLEEPVARESAETRETQTDVRKRAEIAMQTDPAPEVSRIDVSTMTSSRHLSLDEMQPVLTATIARHLAEHQRKSSRRAAAAPAAPEEVEDPKPSKDPEPPIGDPSGARGAPVLNSYNLMPRLTKLRDLDALIAEKSRILRELEMEIEVKRKMNEVIKKRELLKNQKTHDAQVTSEEMKQEIQKTSPSSSSTSTSDSSSESDPSSSSDSTSSSESESESTSSKSSESSEVPPAPDTPKPAKVEEESTIEDPFSARKSPTLSPTSEYLKNLRAKMMEQYTQKYN